MLHAAANPFDPVFLFVGSQGNVALDPFGLAGCTQYSSATRTVGVSFPDALHRAPFGVPVPPNPARVGATVHFQAALIDSNAPGGRRPVYTTHGPGVTLP